MWEDGAMNKTVATVMAAALLPAAVHAQPAVDTTTPRIAVNQEAKDTQAQLQLLQQELYQAQQQIMYLNLQHQYEDRMQIRRMLFPSGKEIVPGYIFSPKQIDKSKKI